MMQEDRTDTDRSLWGTGFNLYLAAWILVPTIALAILLAFLLFGGKGRTVNPDDDRGPMVGENYLAQVRSTLAKQADLTTCRGVVQQLNSHLQQPNAHKVPLLSSADRDRLMAQLGLDKGAIGEVASTAFTPLDAHHIEACFLFRDAAGSLTVSASVGGKAIKQTPLERAEAGFAWAVRQVRLPRPGQPTNEEAAPPAPVLRRSHGSALERALVFLAVLEQFGLDEEKAGDLQGCLVFCPDDKGNRRLWACGVAIGDNLYLFDPRLGLPLPGPGGKGVATLAQARTDPTVLAQLQVDKLRYDVTPEQAKQATLLLVCPLSAVSPRMHLLQDHLLRDRTWNQQQLPSPVRVRLAEDPARALASVQAAVKSSGVKAEDVQFWKEGSILLRRFLPRDEGGNDMGKPYALRHLQGFVAENDPTVVSMQRQKLFQLQAVPWQEFPDYFRDPNHFRWDIGLGQQIRGYYALSFMRPLLEANTTRDMILRGQFTRAVPQLVEEQKQWQQMRARLREAKDLGTGVREWVDRAIAAHANLIRAQGTADEAAAQVQLDQLWKWKLGDPIEVFINGVIAGPRGAEVMYQLALCRHEQAVRHQGRVALAARSGGSLPTEAANARRTWTDAADYWKEFIDINPGRPAVPDARRLRGEALAQLGQVEKAVPLWQDVSAPMSELEKLAVLWLARQSRRGTP